MSLGLIKGLESQGARYITAQFIVLFGVIKVFCTVGLALQRSCGLQAPVEDDNHCLKVMVFAFFKKSFPPYFLYFPDVSILEKDLDSKPTRFDPISVQDQYRLPQLILQRMGPLFALCD